MKKYCVTSVESINVADGYFKYKIGLNDTIGLFERLLIYNPRNANFARITFVDNQNKKIGTTSHYKFCQKDDIFILAKPSQNERMCHD
jgi:hypothetical protein